MLASFTHILPLATVIRKRVLSVDGQVRVKVGQKVKATDVVAETIMGRNYQIIDVARGLRISPRAATALIQFKKGQKVAYDQVIAESKGLLAREVRSPAEGRVVVVGGGKLVLESGGGTVSLMAGLPGVVTEIIPNRGAVIRGSGSIVQGVWGNGHLDVGVLMSVMDRADDVFDPKRLDVSIRNSIIMGGHVDNPAVLKNAIDLPVLGLIIASLAPALIPDMSQAPFPVMVLDGFGRKPMNANAYKLFSTSVRREISLNAALPNRFQGERPEAFITLPVSQPPPELREVETFFPNQTVRILSLTGSARVGTILKINPSLTTLPNGLRVKAAEIQLDTGQQVVAPLTNLEVLG